MVYYGRWDTRSSTADAANVVTVTKSMAQRLGEGLARSSWLARRRAKEIWLLGENLYKNPQEQDGLGHMQEQLSTCPSVAQRARAKITLGQV